MASKYPNSGAIFKNDRKEKDTHPDMTGSAEIDGVEYWINAWTKEGKGKKFLSLSFKVKEAKAEKGSANVEKDDDLPF